MTNLTTTKELNGNTYKVVRTSYLDRVFKGKNIYKNLFKLYKNDSLIKEFTTNKSGEDATKKGFDQSADKVVVVYDLMNGFQEVKCLLNEKAVKRQWFYDKESKKNIITL